MHFQFSLIAFLFLIGQTVEFMGLRVFLQLISLASEKYSELREKVKKWLNGFKPFSCTGLVVKN